jgi:hypothetical protein
VRPPDVNEFTINGDPELEDMYRQIRNSTDDVPKVAEAAGVDPALVDVAKRNVFVNTHDVAVAPGDMRHGNFRPLQEIADLWKAAMDGTPLTREETNALRTLIAHEYVEARLLETGVPYNRSDPRAWDEDGGYRFEPEFAGPHEVAPRSLQRSDGVDLLRHWNRLGLTPPPGGLADDLSNLDEFVQYTKEVMGW